MQGDMVRAGSTQVVRVGTSLANSTPLIYSDFSGAIVHVPATEGAGVTLTYYVGDSDKPDATFRACKSNSGGALTATVNGNDAIEMHPSLFSALRVKIVASAISSGTYVNYTVTMKS